MMVGTSPETPGKTTSHRQGTNNVSGSRETQTQGMKDPQEFIQCVTEVTRMREHTLHDRQKTQDLI